MKKSDMMHGQDWTPELCPDPTGWLITEKFRGCRAEWDGLRLWSKGGNQINAPEWFIAGFPAGVRLSGEIYAGRCKVETSARLAVQYGHFERGVHSFQMFDSPGTTGNVVERVRCAAMFISEAKYAVPITFTVCAGLWHLIDILMEMQAKGGEGAMLYHPRAPWQAGKTTNLLKVKKLSDLNGLLGGYLS